MTLTPAYGRDYKSKKEALEDFNADKDFVANDYRSSAVTNKADLLQMGIHQVQIRYKKMTQVFVHKF